MNHALRVWGDSEFAHGIFTGSRAILFGRVAQLLSPSKSIEHILILYKKIIDNVGFVYY